MFWGRQTRPSLRREDDTTIALVDKKLDLYIARNDAAHTAMTQRLADQDTHRTELHAENEHRFSGIEDTLDGIIKRMRRVETVYYLIAAVISLIAFSGSAMGQRWIALLLYPK